MEANGDCQSTGGDSYDEKIIQLFAVDSILVSLPQVILALLSVRSPSSIFAGENNFGTSPMFVHGEVFQHVFVRMRI